MFTMESIANHTKVNYIILLNITNKEVIAMHADELVECFPFYVYLQARSYNT